MRILLGNEIHCGQNLVFLFEFEKGGILIFNITTGKVGGLEFVIYLFLS